MRSLRTLSVGVVCVFLLAAPTRADEPRDLKPLLERALAEHKAPGACAAVVRDGEIIAVGAAGVRKQGEAAPAARGDLVFIGSCGKSATRLLVGRLLDRGLLRFDSTLGELLPDDIDMRAEYRKVTIADLLGHRGGIQPYTEIGPRRTPILFEPDSGTAQERRARFIAHLLKEEPVAPPGTRFVYSNAGYGLLGHIAERLLKASYEDAMRKEVFEPLGMRSAIVGQPNSAPERVGLCGHVRTPDGYEPARQARPPLPAIAPAGLMSCTIDDFAKFAAFLAASEAGKPGSFFTPQTAAKLRELRPGDAGEGELFFGGDGWYTACVATWPSRGLAIVVGTNAGENDDLCTAIADAARELCAPDAPARGRGVRGAPGAAQSPSGEAEGRPIYGFEIRAVDDNWVVGRVTPGMPAEKAGLKEGDRIVAIGGRPLASLGEEDRREMLRKSPLRLHISRNGAEQELTLKAGP